MDIERNITKQELFSILSQEEIFERYLGTSVVYSKKIRNPLRVDRDPTVTFKWFGQDLIMRDHNGWFTGNCIALVMKIHHCSYSEAINLIYNDMRNLFSVQPFKERQEEKKVFDVWLRQLSQNNLDWWAQYKIKSTTLDVFNVSAVRQAHIGNYWYYYTDADPCYLYKVTNPFNKDVRYKLYFPLRQEYRFMSNIPKNTYCIQGISQLPEEGDYCIITKSLKDVMCMYEFGIPAVALNSESTILDGPVLENLCDRFGKVYVNMDYDYAGICMMNKYKRKGFPLLFFDKTYKEKDFAEYCKNNNESQIWTLKKMHLA